MKSHRYFQTFAIAFALVFANTAPAFCQSPQNNPAPPSQTQIVKEQVQKIGTGENVTVIMLSGLEYYGAISKIESDSFEIAEVDLKQYVTIAYADVRKVETEYGVITSSTGKRHKGSRAGLIVLLVGVGTGVVVAILALTRLRKRQPTLPPFPRFP
jgi:hypothetical protein